MSEIAGSTATSDDLAARVVQEYVNDSGATTYTLAARHRVSRHRVWTILKAAEVDTRRRWPERQPATPEVVAAYQAGSTIERIAEDSGLSYRFVRNGLLAAGVTLRPRKRAVAPCPPGMISAYERGASIRQLAAKYGHSYNVTRTMLLNDGVTLRSRGVGPSMVGDQ
ncbi:helix-turn-helix domain-containing protein [Amycolatopsis lurida]|uniref:helix-turn-helix domain-containing protein n=1 Tax=Amycolatopsis lurida TaxID=31959 RepID=UPI0036689922